MEKAKVYFTDFRVSPGSKGLADKLKKLIKAAGIGQINMDNRFVCIKMHFGELGNMAFLRPNWARAVVDTVKDMGGKPYLCDCNTLYPGSRKNALEHLECAWQNGFSPLSVNCPILIGDGLKGTDDIEIPIRNGVSLQTAKIGRAVMDADVFISLNHFKGHEATGFGGALKNIGMGCGSRAGKKDMHACGKPTIDPNACRGCRQCLRECANDGLAFDPETRKMTVNTANCAGCGRCIGACNFDAISFYENNAEEELDRRIAEYAMAVTDGRPCFHINIVRDISPHCDCHSENDAPILPDVGMFASFDPVALDRACVDACLKNDPLPNSRLSDNMASKDFCDHHDHFENTTAGSTWKECLIHAEKIGIGTQEYELIPLQF